MNRDILGRPMRRDLLSLKDLTVSRALRFLVLAPHPDDFDIIGITLRHFRKNGNPILDSCFINRMLDLKF